MSATFNKPKGLKYTDMCIYIDKHLSEITELNANPEVESRIYEYIYHIVYALACKAGYFKKFIDYDSFSCYAASELYMSMRKKQVNAGKEIRGKKVVPVKSSLNFIKATMFPLKVNYQREFFATVLDPTLHEEVASMETKAREDIQQQYRTNSQECYDEAADQVPKFIREIISETPFRNDPLMCKKLYMSCILTFINDITIPNKLKNKIKSKMTIDNANKYSEKLFNAYSDNNEKAIVWHIDEDISNYIRILVTKAKKRFSIELEYYLHADDLSDEILDSIMSNAYDTCKNMGDDE